VFPTQKIYLCLIGSLYAVLMAFVLIHHEAWFDEVQAWLIARDSGLLALFTETLRYEGHPPLWYLILMPFAKLGAPLVSSNILAALIAGAGVFVLLRTEHVPLPVKALVPFSYFIFFQYGVVARSYALYPLFFFLLASCYRNRRERLGRFTLLLILIGNVSVHGLFIASAIFAHYLLETLIGFKKLSREERKKHLLWLGIFIANGLFLIYVLLPPDNLLFSRRVDFSFNPYKIFKLFWYTQVSAFSGMAVVSVVVHLFSVLWLWQRRLLSLYAVTLGALCLINSVYFNRWHEGISFLNWLFLMVTGYQAEARIQNRWSPVFEKVMASLICIILAIQGYWTTRAVMYDVQHPYTGAAEVARFLAENNLTDRTIAGINFEGISINGYFDHNLYANYHEGSKPAYWDWSDRNTWYYGYPENPSKLQAKVTELLAGKPDIIIVGDKFAADRKIASTIKDSGHYRQVLYAKGFLFWKVKPVESNGFTVFQRVEP